MTMKKETTFKRKKFIYDFGINHYKGLQGIYFNRILKNIISIGKLVERRKLKILDFGCGLKKLKNMLYPFDLNYIGFDIDKRFTEVKNWEKIDFDIIVANAVLMYMTKQEIEAFVKQLYKHNPNVELIFSATKMNFITKAIKFIRGEIDGYADAKTSYQEQLNILIKYFQIINKKTLLGMNDVYLMRFK